MTTLDHGSSEGPETRGEKPEEWGVSGRHDPCSYGVRDPGQGEDTMRTLQRKHVLENLQARLVDGSLLLWIAAALVFAAASH